MFIWNVDVEVTEIFLPFLMQMYPDYSIKLAVVQLEIDNTELILVYRMIQRTHNPALSI